MYGCESWTEKKAEREVVQSCPALCDPMDCSLPGSSVHGVFQAIVLEWIAISFSRGSSQPRDWTRVSCISGRFVTVWATREAHVNHLWAQFWESHPLVIPRSISLPFLQVPNLFLRGLPLPGPLYRVLLPQTCIFIAWEKNTTFAVLPCLHLLGLL